MSGHSHWSTIKRKKGAADEKKGKVFSKLAKEIIMAAKEGGGDAEFNPKLRMIIEKARSFNMPADKIERAVKKGTGEIEAEILESFTLDAYGPEGIALVLEGITDNKQRSLGEIRQILSRHGGKLVQEGATRWMFERKGCIIVSLQADGKKEDLELLAIEAGAEDIFWRESALEIFTKPEGLDKAKKFLEEKGLKIESTSLDWVPKERVSASQNGKNSCEKLFEELDEDDSVQEIYSNLNI